MVETEVKKLRVAKHLSQEQLAEKAKVSVRTIQRLEAGDDASISTLNLVASALGVEVGELFPQTQSAQQKEKIQSADEQLQSQLYQRHEEYHTFKSIYNTCFIVIMMIWGCLFPLIHNNAFSSIAGVLWLGGWLLFGPLKKEIKIKRIDPKLDAKYPLTVNRIDRAEETK